jgi:phosphatidate cytidylyltransferase
VTGVLATIAILFALGGAAILAASLIPAGRATARTLWPFYCSEFLIVGMFLLPAAVGGWAFLALLLMLALRGQWELFTLFGQSWKAPTPALAMAGGLAVVAAGAVAPDRLPAALAVAAGALLVLGRLRSSVTWLAIASLALPALPLALIALLRGAPQGFLWLLLAQATVEMNDSFALLAGKLIGRTRIFPALSPGKTLAGLVCGLLAGLATGLAVAHLLLGLSFAVALAMAATALAAGLAGDLALSALKRWRGAKDFPPLAVMHGGLMDIYDSLLFAAPALLLLRWVMGLYCGRDAGLPSRARIALGRAMLRR